MCRWMRFSQIMGKCGLFELIAGLFIAWVAINFVVLCPLVLGGAATSAFGASPSANVLLRALPEFPLYFAAGDTPTAAEAC